VSTALTYNQAMYDLEKKIGKRRADGARKLQKLKPGHLKMIELHLRGYTIVDIAAELDKPYVTVQRVLTDPLAKRFINQFHDMSKQEFSALRHRANAALRKGLDESQPISTRLRAAEMVYKGEGDFDGEKDNGGTTAEDICAAILAKVDIHNEVHIHKESHPQTSNIITPKVTQDS